MIHLDGKQDRALPEEDQVAADTPLARYITEEAERQGISLRMVARRGGLKEATLAYYMGRWPAKSLPTAEILQGIADGLRAPMARVQAVAMASVGQTGISDLGSEQQTVVAAMSGMDPRAQRAVADIVLRLAEAFRISPE